MNVDKKINALLAAREKHLEKRPIHSIVASIGNLSKNWLKKNFPFRKKAVQRLAGESRLSASMAEHLLDALFGELTAAKLLGLLRSEIGDPLALDGFRLDKRTGKKLRARGPKLVTHIFSGNVPNPSILSFTFGMLVKSANAGKLSSRDGGFLDIFLESLAAADKRLAETNWLLPAVDRQAAEKSFRRSQLVVAYGSDETLAEIKRKVPSKTAFTGYGHRMSASIYLKDALRSKNLESLAKKTAYDVWMADQRGCLSPLAVYAEKGGQAAPWVLAERIAHHLRRLSSDDRKPSTWIGAARHHSLEQMHRILQLKEKNSFYWESAPRGRWAVLYEDKVSFFPRETGGRTAYVFGFDRLDRILENLSAFRGFLQAAALEAPAKKRLDAAERLSELGFNRLCRAGAMQSPPLHWHHDGRPNLASWIYWTDLEE